MPVAQVGPVAYFSVAYPDDIGKSVSAHICQEDGLDGVVEQDGGPFFFVPFFYYGPGYAKSCLADAFIPAQQVLFGIEKVCPAVCVEVQKAAIRVAEVYGRKIFEGAHILPFIIRIEPEKSFWLPVCMDEIFYSIAFQLLYRQRSFIQPGEGGFGRYRCCAAEVAFAQVVFIIPAVSLFCQDAGYPF